MKTALPARRRSLSSFTLVEMLASVAVLAMLLVFIASITLSASHVSDSTGRHADVVEEAREVMDRIGADIDGMLLRPDVDAIFAKQDGNDAFFFYSRTPGYFTDIPAANQSPISLVGYRITASDQATVQPVLQRLAKGMAWSGSGAMNFLTVGAPASLASPATSPGPTDPLSTIAGQWKSVIGSAPYSQGTSPYHHTLGPQVFRMEYCFLTKTGAYTTSSGTLTNNAAIVVTLALIDDKTRKIAIHLDDTARALPDITDAQLTSTPPVLMEESWNKTLQKPDFYVNARMPQAAASQIRVFQRFYYLNLPPAK